MPKVIANGVTQEVQVMGRFTIVEYVNEKGIRGVGIARRCQGDTDKDGVGVKIAKSRALKAIEYKLAKKKINNPLMG